MASLEEVVNPYVRRSRLQPALIVALPLALATLAWFPSGILGWGTLWSLFVWCGGTALLAQIARDAGKKKESFLYERWDGKPTTRMLRHRDAPNAVILEQRHRKLATLIPGIHIPTAKEEAADPTHADQVYDACTAYLLEKTRDKKKFPLVFEENCNYGFRRNLWGMKLWGITTTIVGCVATGVLIFRTVMSGVVPSPLILVCAAMAFFLLLGWFFWFSPDWVRIPADAFADRLLSASENL